MKNLKLALDWTANTNHIGFYVAQELGFYKNAALNVAFVTPDAADYGTTPAKKVELGEVDFALCPFESIISYHTKQQPFNLKAIAGLFQEDLSAIVVKEDSKIKTPADLNGKTYASYQARYEDKIVEQMIINAGGAGDLKISYPEKLSIWESLLNNKADATWVFLNWEAYQAEAKGLKMRYFKLNDYNIPYSYSPVIAVNGDEIEANSKAYSDFLESTKEGFFFAEKYPEKASEILRPFIPKQEQKLDLVASIRYASAYMGDAQTWGSLDLLKITHFINWLAAHQLETSALVANDLIHRFPN